MIDCTLDLMSSLGYLPLSLTHNKQLSSLANWTPPRKVLESANFTFKETRSICYEIKECHSGAHLIDTSPEFALFDTSLVDIKEIDVVLISNYLNMFGLPYLTERLGYTGAIYVTEPTYHFGRIMMGEMIKLIERTPKPRRQYLWKRIHRLVNLSLPRNHSMTRDPNKWVQIFSSVELASCLSKLKVVNYSQSIDIFGLFEVSAHSSGFCIGSCNWVLRSNHEKIVYMSQTSLLTSHPKPFDVTPLRDADIMLLTNLTPSPLINPDSMLGDLFTHTIQTIKNEGNVLIPCYPCGMVYDLVECIVGQLTIAGLTQVPLYFLSPVAEESLAYANILGEWLTTMKQSKVFVPEEPFMHSSLVRAGRLRHFSSVSDPAFNDAFKTPCVLFTSHPSLRFGDVVHFINLWGQSSKNLLVMTEPDYPCQEAINPFLPLAMKVLYIPIDTNWNFRQANNLLSGELRPAHLVLHDNYVTKPSINYGVHGLSSTDLVIELQNAIEDSGSTDATTSNNQVAVVKGNKFKSTTIHSYGYQESFDLSGVRATYERMDIDPSFANQIIQSEIRPGLCFSTVNGSLLARDNKYTLKPIELNASEISRLPPSAYYYGTLNLPLFMELLARSGITDATVEGAKNGRIIELRSMKAVIHVEESQTHIITADPNSRSRLRALVASCLRRF